MNDLDLYRRIEYPNETRQSWIVEAKGEDALAVTGWRLQMSADGVDDLAA
jgi:hypothetical protein